MSRPPVQRHPSPRLWIEVQRFLFVALTVWAIAASLWAVFPERMP